MDKYYTSNVEKARLPEEELRASKGHIINPDQVWMDGQLILGSPSLMKFSTSEVKTDLNGTYLFSESIFNDGQTEVSLAQHIEGLKLNKVEGTKNVFESPLLIDMIGKEFDKNVEAAGNSWQFALYDDKNNKYAYGAGDPIVDAANGTILFRSEEFIEALDHDLYISFYRYSGRKGFLGSKLGIDFPIRDDIVHLKDADSNSRTATFQLEGDDIHTVYVLPGNGGVYRGPSEGTGTIMLEENYNEIDWNIGHHNGGHYLDDGRTVKA